MENFNIDKWLKDSISSERANEYLYNLYIQSPSCKSDVRRGFQQFVINTGLKKKRQLNAFNCASIAVAIVSMVFALHMWFSPKPVSAKWTSVSTAAGESRDLLLSDGTCLHLAPCSNVLYPDVFTDSERKIFAVGDVYFDVAKDEAVPFVVSSNGLDVKVHGTKFHLYSFPGIEDQEVALAQGSVSISFGDNTSELFLEPGEMLKYNKGRNVCTKMTFDVESFQSQMSEEQMFFDNEDLITIARKLSNRFGVRVVVCDNALMGQKYYASFVNGESLDAILSTLGRKGRFSVKHVGDDYLIVK